VQENLPALKNVIYWHYKGLANQKNSSFLGYRDVLTMGREYEKNHPQVFENNLAAGKTDDICAIVYTSGTTGQDPKGVLHSYRTLRYASDFYFQLDHPGDRDNLVSNLPPAWITEQWLVFGCHLLSAGIVNFAEGAETQQQDIREIGPQIVLYSSRLWERQAGTIQARIQGAGLFKRLAYHLFMPVGYRMADMRARGLKPGWYWQILGIPANLLLFRPVRDSLGLPHARVCYSAGATLSPEAYRFYHALNVPLRNLFGSTEAGAITGSSSDDFKLDTAGRLNPNIEIKISPSGEILVRHPGLFLGYYGEPSAASAVLKDGWLNTGDSGSLTSDGYLVFLDRVQDIVKLAGGDFLYPQEIESRLKYSPYIKDAWIMAGPEKREISAVIVIDSENSGHWADKHKVIYTTYGDLSQKEEVYGLIEQEIKRVNRKLPTNCRITRFVNLHKEFDPDEGELTRTRKLRKTILKDKYTDLIKAVYSGQPSVEMEVQIRYQDGRTGNLKTMLKIQAVKEGLN
jgi:long-chain acyl-CoA synthetase